MYEEMAFKMGPQNRSLTRRFEATSTQGKGALKRKDLDGKSKELKGQSLCTVGTQHKNGRPQQKRSESAHGPQLPAGYHSSWLIISILENSNSRFLVTTCELS